MKPFGINKTTPGSGILKTDYHLHDKNHRKVGNWWEYFAENTLPRTTVKKNVKQEINKELYGF